jgi:hypothetical protein
MRYDSDQYPAVRLYALLIIYNKLEYLIAIKSLKSNRIIHILEKMVNSANTRKTRT